MRVRPPRLRVQVLWSTVSWGLAIALLIVSTVALLYNVRDTPGVNVKLEVAKALLSLLTALLITGGVSYAITWRMQRRAELLARLEALTSIFQELKSAFEYMSQVRGTLRAHLSGRTFELELPKISEARSKLQRIERDETLRTTDGLAETAEAVSQMVAFTRGAGEFYRKNYDVITLDALREDGLRERYKRGEVELEGRLPEMDISNMPKNTFLTSLLGDREQWKASPFAFGYDIAQKGLNSAIQRARAGAKTSYRTIRR